MTARRAHDTGLVLAALRRCARLDGVPEEDLARAAAASALREVAPGREVFSAGERSTALFVVDRGRIASRIRSRDGALLDVGYAGAGDMFGYFEVFDGAPRDCDAVAVEASWVVAVPPPWGRRLLTGSSQALVGVVEDLLAIVRQHDEARAALRFEPVTTRLARHLLAVGDAEGRVVLDGSQTLLAQRLGTARQTLNRALRTLAADGVIELAAGGRALRVLDPARLGSVARLE